MSCMRWVELVWTVGLAPLGCGGGLTSLRVA